MKRYFNTYYIKNGLIIAIFLSLPLYLIHFDIDNKIINSILLIVSIYIFYKNDIKTYPWIGFFTSIFWLWWISLSFRYYGLSFLIPFIILGIGVFYWIIFYLLTFLRFKILIIAFFIFGLQFIKPFGFDWFRYDILLPHTYFYISNTPIKPAPIKIKIINTKIPQNKKWDRKFIPIEIDNNFKYIQNAIDKNYDVVVLPETAFPIPLDRYPKMIKYLQNLSQKIIIITGALSYQKNKYYNSTYLFENKKIKIFNKHILVPFGEYIPLPCCKKLLNKIFFNGADDFIPAPNFSTYKIKNIQFLNAICYEVTNENLYKQKPKYIIAISNNAWFYPSIEETLQKLLIEFYSHKYKKYVYHAINY